MLSSKREKRMATVRADFISRLAKFPKGFAVISYFIHFSNAAPCLAAYSP